MTQPSMSGLARGQAVGPYVLAARLGGGAMSAVYRAIDRRSQRQVAIKLLLPGADAVMRERFRREAQTHSLLTHPNIVQIDEVGEASDTGLTYIVMELVNGPNLSDVMEETPRMPAPDAARLLEPIARALTYSSAQGIIHRDVKPSNVLLRRVAADTPGAVKIAGLDEFVIPLLSDFGIARALDAPELTSVGRTIGTPTYMSPEQCADSHEIDGRSDLYSLGAVFYRCIVGRPPFSGSTTQILHAHVYEPLTIPEEVLGGLPPLAVTVLRRSLAKEPGQRYANGAEMARDLYLLAAADGAGDVGDDTATMAALPSVRHAAAQAVLIPAPDLASAMGSASRTADFIPVEPIPMRGSASAATARHRPRRRWIGALAGATLAALVLLGGAGLAFNLLPEGIVATVVPTPTMQDAVVVVATPVVDPSPTATALSAVTDASPTTPVTPESPAATTPVQPRPTPTPPAPVTATPLPPAAVSAAALAVLLGTPSVLPTPVGDIEGFWADAGAAFADQAWEETLASLTLVRRIDQNFEREAVEEMLFESWMGLAATYIADYQLGWALELIDAAAALRPGDRVVADIGRDLRAFTSPDRPDKQTAGWALARDLLVYGTSLAVAEKPCLAAAQFEAAERIRPDQDVSALLAENQVACIEAREVAATRLQLLELRGRLLYSTQEGDRFLVYQMPAALDAVSTLVIQDAAQPARQRSGMELAFHSTDAEAPGIGVVNLAAGLGFGLASERITTAAADAKDAPPSWSAGDRRLAYASTALDGRSSRIYLVEPGTGTPPANLALGRDPAWHPLEDLIVYNDTGSEPGLWLMDGAGGERTRLTDNGNDMRPAWTPDGQAIVFMSTRDGNSELYRLDMASRVVRRLTDNPAQDGLPAVSPDGKWIAFASDRSGQWQIFALPIEGGREYPLASTVGELTSWLEHAIQWIP